MHAATLKKKLQTCFLIQSQYTSTRPINPSSDPMKPGTWQGSHQGTSLSATGMTGPGKHPKGKEGLDPRSATGMAGPGKRPKGKSEFNPRSATGIAGPGKRPKGKADLVPGQPLV